MCSNLVFHEQFQFAVSFQRKIQKLYTLWALWSIKVKFITIEKSHRPQTFLFIFKEMYTFMEHVHIKLLKSGSNFLFKRILKKVYHGFCETFSK